MPGDPQPHPLLRADASLHPIGNPREVAEIAGVSAAAESLRFAERAVSIGDSRGGEVERRDGKPLVGEARREEREEAPILVAAESVAEDDPAPTGGLP